MILQEQGVAVGWPLNLGHDTTGWPLGLRLRLLHEDLQWPRNPELARSSSGVSTDSSSLDTVSTRSFFQDNTKSLGALMGLPILDSDGNPVRFQHQQQEQQQQPPQPYRLAFGSPSTFGPNTPAPRGGLQNANSGLKRRAKARRLHHYRSPAQQQQQQQRHDLSPSSAASSAGWSLLSALSCARVPAEIGAAVNADEEISIPRAQSVAREIPLGSFAQDPELDLQGNHERAVPPLLLTGNSSPPHLNYLAKKLYDNITFEDEELEMRNKQRRSPTGLSSDTSSELNPLFASSPQAAQEEEKNEPDSDYDEDSSRRAGTMTSMCDQFLVQRASCTVAVPFMTILGRSNNDSNATLYCRNGSRLRIRGSQTSMSFCLDVGKWQQTQKQLGHGMSQLVKTKMDDDSRLTSHESQQSLKSRAVSAFIYRMVCCRSTPTRGSSF